MSNLNVTPFFPSAGGISPVAQGVVSPQPVIAVSPRQFTGDGCTVSWESATGIVSIVLDQQYPIELVNFWLTGITDPFLSPAAPAQYPKILIDNVVVPTSTTIQVLIPTRNGNLPVDPPFFYWPGFNFAVFVMDAASNPTVDMADAPP